jgi:hypothetical protein
MKGLLVLVTPAGLFMEQVKKKKRKKSLNMGWRPWIFDN